MRVKRTSSMIALTMIVATALASPSIVSPASYHDLGVHAAHSTSVASSTTPNASSRSYHDL